MHDSCFTCILCRLSSIEKIRKKNGTILTQNIKIKEPKVAGS